MWPRTGTISTCPLPEFAFCPARLGCACAPPAIASTAATGRSRQLVLVIANLGSSLLFGRSRVALFHDLARQLGVHRLGAAPGGLDRNIVLLSELAEEVVLAGKLMRHLSSRPVHCVDHFAGVR